MEDRHLVNSIKFMFKARIEKYTREAITKAYSTVIRNRLYDLDKYQERLEAVENSDTCREVFDRYPKLKLLIREAAKRGLTWDFPPYIKFKRKERRK